MIALMIFVAASVIWFIYEVHNAVEVDDEGLS